MYEWSTGNKMICDISAVVPLQVPLRQRLTGIRFPSSASKMNYPGKSRLTWVSRDQLMINSLKATGDIKNL